MKSHVRIAFLDMLLIAIVLSRFNYIVALPFQIIGGFGDAHPVYYGFHRQGRSSNEETPKWNPYLNLIRVAGKRSAEVIMSSRNPDLQLVQHARKRQYDHYRRTLG